MNCEDEIHPTGPSAQRSTSETGTGVGRGSVIKSASFYEIPSAESRTSGEKRARYAPRETLHSAACAGARAILNAADGKREKNRVQVKNARFPFTYTPRPRVTQRPQCAGVQRHYTRILARVARLEARVSGKRVLPRASRATLLFDPRIFHRARCNRDTCNSIFHCCHQQSRHPGV